jgi:WD40 repeat protein
MATTSPTRKSGSGRTPVQPPPTIVLSESVVSSLATQSEEPYVALGLSPCRRFAVAARKDTIVVLDIGDNSGSSGDPTLGNANSANHNNRLALTVRKSIGGISTFFESAAAASKTPQHQHLYAPANSNNGSSSNTGLNLRSFAYGPRSGGTQSSLASTGSASAAITITEVSWGNDNLIAIAGSNGSILVWSKQILLSTSLPEKKEERTIRNKNNINRVSPEAVFPQLHNRAINRLSWHPTLSNVLLSASHDASVILWEPIEEQNFTASNDKMARFSFGFSAGNAKRQPLLRWQSKGIFKPKGDGVRDVRWSPHYTDGTFPFMTDSFFPKRLVPTRTSGFHSSFCSSHY